MSQVTLLQDGEGKKSIHEVAITGRGSGSKIAPQTLGEVVRFAEVMAKADIALPQHLRGNVGACMAVAMQALEWEMSPFAVASKSYSVKGAIAYEAQLIAAVVNTRSGITGRLKYSYTGEGNELVCTVTGVIDGEEFIYESPDFNSITPKNSPLWKTDPRQQLGYFSSRSWARRYTPEVLLGVYDREEVEQFRGPDNARDVTRPQTNLAQQIAARQASETPKQEPQEAQEGFNLALVEEQAAALQQGNVVDADPIVEDTKQEDPAPAEAVEFFPAVVAKKLHAKLATLKAERAIANLWLNEFQADAEKASPEDQLALEGIKRTHIGRAMDEIDEERCNELCVGFIDAINERAVEPGDKANV